MNVPDLDLIGVFGFIPPLFENVHPQPDGFDYDWVSSGAFRAKTALFFNHRGLDYTLQKEKNYTVYIKKSFFNHTSSHSKIPSMI